MKNKYVLIWILAVFGNIAQEKVVAIFPKTVAEFEFNTELAIEDAQQRVAKIIALDHSKRTFANTACALDRAEAFSDFATICGVTRAIRLLQTDKLMEEAVHKSFAQLRDVKIELFDMNKQLYEAFKAYCKGNAKIEKLTEEQQYFLQERMKMFEQDGLGKDELTFIKIQALKKDLVALGLTFEKNITQDSRAVVVQFEELQGINQDFINTLEKTENYSYFLKTDRPTVSRVLATCDVASTRKQLFLAFINRGYPKNKEILEAIIKKSDKLAKLLDFTSRAHLDLDSQMAHTPERVQKFIDDVLNKIKKKANKEFELLVHDLPESVLLTKDGKIQPWDIYYARAKYKKKNVGASKSKHSEYFVLEDTIEKMFVIFQEFFGITFKQESVSGLWFNDLNLITARRTSDNLLLGYIIADLHPRKNKYDNACVEHIIPGLHDEHGLEHPATCILIMNLPKSHNGKPTLLSIGQVTQLFHEFGHVVHELLGRTSLASFAGIRVKTDFIETPSQMIENLIKNRNVLKRISCHYKTSKPLSEEEIDAIVSSQAHFVGQRITEQLLLTQLSLDCYGDGAFKNLDALFQAAHEKILNNHAFSPENHKWASFLHLIGHGPKYYSYLWSEVFAIDLLKTIENKGLLCSDIGEKYVQSILSKGGSRDPNILLKDFLGREPNQEAFLDNIGLYE